MRRAIVAAVLFLTVSAFGQNVRKVITIPIALPRNYVPTTIPAYPLDESIRVCAVLPSFDTATSAAWNVSTWWEDGGKGDIRDYGDVDRIVLSFSESTEAALPRIVKRLFPRSEVTQAPHPQCELVLRFSMQSSPIVEGGRLQGVTVSGAAAAYGPDGSPLTGIHESGKGLREKNIYWSNQSEARGLGEPALQMMLDHLFGRLAADPDLTAYLKSRAAERARPSDLETTVRFDDGASFFPNGRLDAGEQGKLLFTVKNRGAGPAFAVHLDLSSAGKGVAFPAKIEVGDIAAGASKDIAIAVGGALDVESALQKLRVETNEKRGYGGRPVILELPTQRLNKPAIEIADISVSGRPANGDAIDATVLVRNSGPGDAVGAHLSIESAPGVEIADPKADVGPIPANAVREARFRLRLPITFAGADLPLTVKAEEVRGAQVAQTSRTATWPLELKRPAIELTYRLFDGNSPQSRGDRDGVANNGETLELALTPVNRGTLAARGVSVTITSRQPGVTVSPQSFSVEDLPPLSEGTEHRVRVVVPRTIGRDAALDKLPFGASVTQRDFAPNEQPIALPFQARRPEIAATITSLAPLVEGASATFALEVRNRGGLEAENVRVEVSSDNGALQLLDASDAPAGKLAIDVGTVGAQAVKIQIKAFVPRNLPAASTSLALAVRQADFPPLATQTAAFAIQRQDAVVVSAEPLPVPPTPQPLARSSAVPAISFQRYDNGQRVNEEWIALRFEVQSETALETVRLEQNHRAIDPGTPNVLRDRSGGVWQYEPRVQLDYGENQFEVVAVTTEGARRERPIIINRERPQGRVWVAAVGISKYADSRVRKLDYARDDAAAVLEYYRQFGLPQEQLIALFDEQATLGNIKRSLGRELVDKASNPDDTVILYFAGHGDRESDRGSVDSDGYSKYLLPYDADPADLFSSALSMEELSRIIKRLRPERVVLIIDSCFSGGAGGRTLDEPDVAGRAPISDEFLARMVAAGRGRVILTASSGQEVAKEGARWRHGVFTHFLLEALRGAADSDRDGRIDIDEIFKYVSEHVAAATNGQQTPMKKAPNVTGTVLLGRRLGP